MLGRSLKRAHHLLVGRRRLHHLRIERRREYARRLTDVGKLAVLIRRDELVERECARHFRKLCQPGCDRARLRQAASDDLGGIGAGLRLGLELVVGRDRFRMRIAQIHRIEVERQINQER